MKETALSFLMAIVVFLLVPLVGLSQPKYGGRLVVGLHAELGKIDPHKQTTGPEQIVASLVCNNLVGSGRNYEPRPALAESWEVSEDVKVWTYHLRRGVKFHNGRELTAEDIKWNLERMLDPKTGGGMRSRLMGIDSIETPDPRTVRVTLKEPSASFRVAFFGTIIHCPIIAPECVDEDNNADHPIGTGPFEFAEWKPLEHYKVKRFGDYWEKGLPYLDEVILKEITNNSTRLMALKTGELDFSFSFDMNEAVNLIREPLKGMEIIFGGDWGTLLTHFNTSKPPFDDVRVRQAVAYGIDREEILLGASFGEGEVTNQCFHGDSPWHVDVPIIPRNIEKARTLLKEAGYPDGLDVELLVPIPYGNKKAQAEVMQAQLKEIGMNLKLDLCDLPTYFGKCRKGEFQFGVFSDGGTPADPNIRYPHLITGKGAYAWLFGNYDNPQLTNFLTEADRVLDFDKRRALYTQAIKIFVDEAPYIYTHFQKNSFGWRSHVKGYVPHIAPQFRYIGGGLHYVWLDK